MNDVTLGSVDVTLLRLVSTHFADTCEKEERMRKTDESTTLRQSSARGAVLPPEKTVPFTALSCHRILVVRGSQNRSLRRE